MSFFKKVEGDAAILSSNGVFKQVDLYTRDGYVFAAYAGGFIRIMSDGSTSKAGVSLDFMSWGAGPLAQRLGRLCTGEVQGGKWLASAEENKLLGGPAS